MPVINVAKFERFFRLAAGLDVDRDDLKRYSDFVGEKLYDLLVIAQASAKANSRDVLQPSDLPVTKGLQERIHEYEKLAYGKGFLMVSASPLTRSSHHAGADFARLRAARAEKLAPVPA